VSTLADFIIQFGKTGLSVEAAGACLRERSGMEHRTVDSWQFPWGTVVHQRPNGYGYGAYHCDAMLCFAVGRPRLVGLRHEDLGDAGFARAAVNALRKGNTAELCRSLTGIFAVVFGTEDSIFIITDRLGAYPVYVGQSAGDITCAVGSYPELVAAAAGRQSDYDLVSLGEVLLSGEITFPFTTRRGMCELAPGSTHDFRFVEGSLARSSELYWEPREPARWPSLNESRAKLRQGLLNAGADVSRGVNRVAVTLSGGSDSRTVLSCIPREKLACAITFADWENAELTAARKVAHAASVPHVAIWRHPDFYAHLPMRELSLRGIEQLPLSGHGYLVHDSNIPDVDLIVSGAGSDSILKACWLPFSTKQLVLSRFGFRQLVVQWHRYAVQQRCPGAIHRVLKP